MEGKIWIPALCIERICALMLSVVFLISSTMTGSFAWHHIENAINTFFGGNKDYSVVLEKYERDIYRNETSHLLEGAIFDLYYIEETLSSPGITEFVPSLIKEGLVTDENGLIQLEELDEGEYYFLETSPPYGYTYDKDETGGNIRKYYFSLTGKAADETVKVTAYNQRLTGRLNITKTVENENGEELTDSQKEQEYTFRVTFGENGESSGGEYYYHIVEGMASEDVNASNDTKEEQKLTDGTLTLKHGQTAVFHNLPAGMYYSVTEEVVPGYEIRSNDHQNEIPPLSEKEEGITAEFINIYGEGLVETALLIISKEVTSDDTVKEVDPEQEFIFLIQIGDDPDWEYVYTIQGREMVSSDTKETNGSIYSGETITLRDGEQAVFELPVGTWWEVEETPASGYIPLATKMTGTVIANSSAVGYENRADFVNHQKSEEIRTGELLVSKRVVGKDVDLDAEFTFQISFSDGKEGGDYTYQKNGSGEKLSLNNGSFTLGHGETACFTDLPEGITWQIAEVEQEGYIASVNKITGTVIHAQTGKAEFINYQKDPDEESETGDLFITKEVTGDVPEEEKSREFEFTIRFGDGNSYPYYLNGSDTVYQSEEGTIHLRGSDTVHFKDIPAGITYSVEETPDKLFNSAITSAQGIIPEGEWAEVTFVNHWNDGVMDDTGELEVSKAVVGTEHDPEDIFTFSISFSDGKEYSYQIEGKEYQLENGTFSLKGGEIAVFRDIPEGIGYVVTEETSTGYIRGKTEQQGTVAGSQTSYAAFVNYRIEETELLIKKVVVGEGAQPDKEFYFTLTVKGGGTEEDITEAFILKDGEEKLFRIPKNAQYNLTEKSEKDYIQSSVTNGYGTGDRERIEIMKTNTKKPVVIDPPPPGDDGNLGVQKLWKGDGEDVRPGYIQVQLYRDGQPFGSTVRVDRETNWKHTWMGLPGGYIWTVDELRVSADYEKQISGSQSDGYVITNTYLKEYPGDGDGNKGITDPNGNGSGGSGTGSGNTGADGNGGRSGSAKTGDETNIWLWSLLMIGSAVALRSMLLKNPRFKEE